MKIGYLFEHPSWSNPLLEAFSHRNTDLEKVNVGELAFNTSGDPNFNKAINRINIMPSADCDQRVVFHTQHYLNWLEQKGVRILNGARSHAIGSSKVMQNAIFNHLGLNHPTSIAIYRLDDALAAARKIGFPVIAKPNIGGSGSGIGLFQTEQELVDAIRFKTLDFGVDRSGLIQRYIQSDGYVYRVEVLGDNLFYSIRQSITEGSFNYCAADGCSTQSELPNQSDDSVDEFDFCAIGGEDRIQTFEPHKGIVQSVIDVVKHSGADFGGVEFFMESTSQQPCFYDFNPYSNFVSNGKALLGFSPEDRFIDFALDRLI